MWVAAGCNPFSLIGPDLETYGYPQVITMAIETRIAILDRSDHKARFHGTVSLDDGNPAPIAIVTPRLEGC